MSYLHLFIYYTFICSSVLFYCIGLNRTLQIYGNPIAETFRFLLKALITILISSVTTYGLTKGILIPLKIVELSPLIALIVLLIFSFLLESLLRISTEKDAAEFSVSFMIVLLAVSETTNIMETLVICLSSLTAFVILLPLIYSFEKRIHINVKNISEKTTVLLFLSIAVLILTMAVCDVSWLNLK